MKLLSNHQPTREQLPIVSRTTTGIVVIRGAAGSGKTTSAILRLTAMVNTLVRRRNMNGDNSPIKALVLSFNRTLAGYIDELIELSIKNGSIPIDVVVENDTFSNWVVQYLGNNLISDSCREGYFRNKCNSLGYDISFILDEIDYIRGRFLSENINDYLTIERTGRGIYPQVTRDTRQKLIDIIHDYNHWISSIMLDDWYTQCEKMLNVNCLGYDIVIVDEAQDFSANQIRVIQAHLAPDYYLTFVIDTIQRLYPRGFTWIETGLDMSKAIYHKLKENHRNTIEIAKFASSLISGLTIDDDGSISDLSQATKHGRKPIICEGLYKKQLEYAVNYIKSHVNLDNESVAFLKPRGGGWFDEVKRQLTIHNLKYSVMTKNKEWPIGNVNIALSTMNSVKGLEFDHIIILGINNENTHYGNDDKNQQLRRLLAMAISRARESVIIGYKESEKSNLIDYFSNDYFDKVIL
ncbi:3'-5' exonuclease [Xenorhabdus innexi]|uniref:DNA 3'-5' helicase II n=1 Tax=Xenorhabdus innexi TaxID=290109 RepID=A0A1N6MUB4_9GAMM|nr:3'-5' exonuclease [Xenorhabdus innexi]PHM36464.1 Helicase IV [Xenorhabdus innexi]SIP72412.1 Superfamily I DNA and RNA helicase-like protein [Xenorhabdus innexi]